jgi:DUF2934 family protein
VITGQGRVSNASSSIANEEEYRYGSEGDEVGSGGDGEADHRRRDVEEGAAPEITQEMIAERAYHISQSGEGGTDEENWHRAEAELRQGS